MIENFQQFFLNYKSFYNQIIQDDLINYSTILGEVGIITENGLKEEEVLTSNYNIFNILKVEQYEDKTHTLILLDLFNIQGNHRQKDLFYKLLIEQLIPDTDERIKFLPDNPRFFKIKTQESLYDKTFGKGFIDIFIDYVEPGKKSFSIVIENKIYHTDGKNQLNKYYSFLDSPPYRDNILLIYLTLNGKPPDPISMGKVRVKELELNGKLKIISYNKDINTILSKSLPNIKSDKVKYNVLQYLTMISTL